VSNPVGRLRREYTLALVLDVVGAGMALLAAGRTWQSVTLERPGLRPLAEELSGRTVDSAGTALALAALAAVVALLATRGWMRRGIGALTALVGVALVWRSSTAGAAVSASRARSLVADRFHGAVLGGAAPHVQVHPLWPWLSAGCGVLIALAGALTAGRGQRWQALSGRYETPAAAEGAAPVAGSQDTSGNPGAADLALWKALDRGDDPTA
jgi:uncharacterized membrane protein (TIGR02234 family)